MSKVKSSYNVSLLFLLPVLVLFAVLFFSPLKGQIVAAPAGGDRVLVCHIVNRQSDLGSYDYQVLETSNDGSDGSGNNDHTSHTFPSNPRPGEEIIARDIIGISDLTGDGTVDATDCYCSATNGSYDPICTNRPASSSSSTTSETSITSEESSLSSESSVFSSISSSESSISSEESSSSSSSSAESSVSSLSSETSSSSSVTSKSSVNTAQSTTTSSATATVTTASTLKPDVLGAATEIPSGPNNGGTLYYTGSENFVMKVLNFLGL